MRLLDWWSRRSEGVTKGLEDTWPLLTMGLIGGTLFLGGLFILIRGW